MPNHSIILHVCVSIQRADRQTLLRPILTVEIREHDGMQVAGYKERCSITVFLLTGLKIKIKKEKKKSGGGSRGCEDGSEE